jgi:hypothetical protein
MKQKHLLDDLWKVLDNFSRVLVRKVEVRLPEIKQALAPSTPLPKGCPDHAALALLILRDVKKPMSEMVAAIELIEARIRSHSPAPARERLLTSHPWPIL